MSYYTEADHADGLTQQSMEDMDHFERMRRQAHNAKPVVRVLAPLKSGKRADYFCEHCGKVVSVRKADRARGWGKCCSKSCAASRKIYRHIQPWHVRHGLKAKVSRNKNVVVL